MNSSIIGKIEKAQRYEHEPERVSITSMEATFHGEHSDYQSRLGAEPLEVQLQHL